MFKIDLAKRKEMILKGNVLKILIIMSIPTIMTGVVGALIPFVDTLYANKYLGNTTYAAISYSQTFLSIMISISQGIAIAAMAIIGDAIGKNKINHARHLSLQIFMFAMFLGVILMPVCYLSSFLMSKTVTLDMQENVQRYIAMYSFVIPFYFMAGIYNSIKNITGNPEAVLIRMFLIFIFKLLFNYIYLAILQLGLKGTILSSLSAYIVISVWMYYDIFLKESIYRLDFREYKFHYNTIKEVLKIGLPSSMSFAMSQLGFILINFEIVKYGSIAVAALGIAGQINNLCFIIPSNLGGALTTMVSTNIGANNKKRAKKAYKWSLIISVCILLVLAALIYINNTTLISYFTSSLAVKKIATESLNVYLFTFIPFAVFSISQSVLTALGRTEIPLFLGFLRIWLIRYIFILLTQKYIGYYSIFYGNLLSNVIAGIIVFIIVAKIEWVSVIKFRK